MKPPAGRFASAAGLAPLVERLVPWLAAAAGVLLLVGLALGLLVAPADPLQGEAGRIGIVHVPAAWASLLLYVAMSGCGALALASRSRVPALWMAALAPTGTLFTVIALATGSLWGRPASGTWWAWDARLTSELILLFLYIGFLSLRSAIDDPRRADRASAVLVIVGVVNVPILYLSVLWWNTSHQGAAPVFAHVPGTAYTMLLGTAVVAIAFGLYAAAVSLARVRCAMLEREADQGRLRRGELA